MGETIRIRKLNSYPSIHVQREHLLKFLKLADKNLTVIIPSQTYLKSS